ncbi:coenzyme Q-binding protein COQ10 -like protein [Tropilaelaps mercedesae]|uniref:Coenzyme Q-binding protein COQ10-like protein n=1 Tax=Tropilaelaps mercedesae TaxID=418985 RepID=A0A1V9X1W9_9ACAR|nr:coenzyme Q-binding protein COQ10 -like protein [Tropilaelaps mercedesae]
MAASLARNRTLHFFKNFTNCKALRGRERCLFSLLNSSDDRLSHRERRLVGFSQQQMYQVVSDTDRYPEFLPWCHRSQAIARRGLVENVQLTVGFAPFKETYISEVTRHEPHRIYAYSAEGTFFRDLESRWSFVAQDKHSCILDFEVKLTVKSSLQAPLATIFLTTTASHMSRAFIDRAKELYGKPSCDEQKLSDAEVRS